jgi:hypothetical protein
MIYGFGGISINFNEICCGDIEITLQRDVFSFKYLDVDNQVYRTSPYTFNKSQKHEATITIPYYTQAQLNTLLSSNTELMAFPRTPFFIEGYYYSTEGGEVYFYMSNCILASAGEVAPGRPLVLTYIGNLVI